MKTRVMTNVVKIPATLAKKATSADMLKALKASKSRSFVIDCETYARDFNRQEHIDAFLDERVKAGKKITAVTHKSANKSADEMTKEMALDCKRSNIRIIQVAASDGLVCVFDSDSDPHGPVAKFLTGKSIIGQNLKFDLKALMTHHPDFRPGEIFDVGVAHKLVRTRMVVEFFRSRLQDVVSYWANVDLAKEHGGSDWNGKISPEMFQYAVDDVRYLHEVMEKQAADLNTHSINLNSKAYFCDRLFDKVSVIEMRFVEVLAKIEMAGMPVNVEALRARLKASQEEIVVLKKPLGDLNTQSSKQMIAFLDEHGVDTVSASKDELIKYVSNPIVRDLLRVKTLQKEIQMIDDYLHIWMRPDGRIYSSYNQSRAAGGRMSSSDPNAQQIPRAIKGIFYKSTKKRPVQKADYPSIEARIMGGPVAHDEAIIEIFRSKKDMHIVTAATFVRKPEAEVTKDERLKGKGSNFGFMFGMGPLKFIQYAFINFGLVVTLEEAEELRNGYMSLYRGVKAFLKKNAAKLAEHRKFVAHTVLGRQMMCDGYTNANNWPVQGTAAEMIKLASVLFHDRCLKENVDGRILNIIHDELVIDSSAANKKKAGKILKQSMEDAANYIITEFTTEVEVESV